MLFNKKIFSAPVVTDYPYPEYEYPEETTTLEPEYELEIPKHTLVAMLAVAVLFLFPVTIFVDSAATSINRRPNRRPAGSSTTTTSDPDSFTRPVVTQAETTTTTNIIPRYRQVKPYHFSPLDYLKLN